MTRQVAKEATFLTYSDNDVEHDLIRIIELLNANKVAKVKIVLVFDELDKLMTNDKGNEYLEEILGKLKNILSSLGMVSIFIGGLDLYQKWNDDIAKMNSLYDSIFNWHLYVPCIWDSIESLFDLMMEKDYVYEKMPDEFSSLCRGQYLNIIKLPFRMFLIYINFKSKGIPRKIYSEFNKFIVWNNKTPYFQLTELDIREMIAYAGIWEKIASIFEDKLYKTVIEMDITYLTCFTLIEYLFMHSNERFTIEQVQHAVVYENSISPIDIRQIISELFIKFEEQHVIQKDSENQYIVSDRTIQQENEMTIKDKTLLNSSYEKWKLPENNEDEESKADKSFGRNVDRYKSEIIKDFFGFYAAKKVILRNTDMSIFYIENKISHKKYNAILYNDKKQKSNNLDEYEIVSKYLLDTTNIIAKSNVKTSLISLYKGYLLSHLIKAKIHTKYVLLIVEQLLEFVAEINKQGYFSANIKANNIMIDQQLHVKVLDIRGLNRINSKKVSIFTVGYAAPEMYTEKYDERCDIYSIGVLLWEMVSQKCINEIAFERHIEFQFLERPKHCSKRLWEIVIKATEYTPNERYQSPEEFLRDIRSCREYVSNVKRFTEEVALGTVRNVSDNSEFPILEKVQKAKKWEQTAPLLYGNTETVLLHIDNSPIEEIYLYRSATDEMRIIDKEEFFIGKDKEYVDFCLDCNERVSRIHAKIMKSKGEYYLYDNDSANGTYLNDERVRKAKGRKLKHGDIIKLGNEKIVVLEKM